MELCKKRGKSLNRTNSWFSIYAEWGMNNQNMTERKRMQREREIIIIIEWNCVNDSILLLVLNSSPKLLTTVSSRSFFFK